MIEFHLPTMEDYVWLAPILWNSGYPGAEYTFHNMFLWSGYYGGVAEVDGFAVQGRTVGDRLLCAYPVGPGDASGVIRKLEQEARERGLRLCLRGLTQTLRQELETAFPGAFDFTPYRDSFDYIYSATELTELRGKKLQAKRNHCNRFIAEHPDWYTREVRPEDLELCRQLARIWYEGHEESPQIAMERVALERAFANYEALHMDGLLLFDGQRPVGFSMGARMNPKMYDVNFEKAYYQVQGAYSLINREFSRYVAQKYPELELLNREDDMGEPGLRRAKESYQPTILLEKFVAKRKEGA